MKTKFLLIILALFFSQASAAVKRISVQALFTGKAMVSVDGTRRMLSIGKPSPEGVVLISANSSEAVLEVNGKQGTYLLGSEVGTNYMPVVEVVEQVFPDSMGMYNTVGSINGLPVDFMVDTGATLIAMNEQQAKRLGIDFRFIGKVGRVATASEIVKAYHVNLNIVKVGKIELRNVKAIVMEGPHPYPTLLGMSFLGRLKIESNGRALVLKQRP